MKHAMIALMIVSLGAMAPVPAAQGVMIEDSCVGDPLASVDITLPASADACIVPCQDGVGFQVSAKQVCTDTAPGTAKISLCEADGSIGLQYGERSACLDGQGLDPCASLPASCQELPTLGKPPCPRTEDDGGFGGTRVTCYYRCMPLDELHISVTAADPDAQVEGYTDCGGAHADCPRLKVHCQGVSGEVAEDSDERGCVGRSFETWSSEVTVTCTAVGTGLVCAVVDCDLGASASVRIACVEDNPSTPSDVVVQLLSNVPPGPVQAFSVAHFKGAGTDFTGWGLVYDRHDDTPSCWAGPL